MAALVAFFVYWHMVEAGRIVVGKKLAGFMALMTSAFLGVLYELEEYLEDVFTGGNRRYDDAVRWQSSAGFCGR